MAERDSYKPGTFCWVELGTTDPDGAKAFYSGLFGWEAEDMPVGEGRTYTMLRLGGRDVGALQQAMEEGSPPFWSSYVSVEDADATAKRAQELGATLHGEPFDVTDAGRMAVVQDPQGAVFFLWQPADHFGAGLVNAPGAVTLNQLNTSDPEAAGRFYSELFGWEVGEVESPGPSYWGIYNGTDMNGGLMELPAESPAPPHWLVYFGSDDIDASVAKIGELGGSVMVPPMPIPAGRIAVAADPQGAFLALFEGRFDP